MAKSSSHSDNVKCRYCGMEVQYYLENGINLHECFSSFNEETHNFCFDDNNDLCMVLKETQDSDYADDQNIAGINDKDMSQSKIDDDQTSFQNAIEFDENHKKKKLKAGAKKTFTIDEEEMLITCVRPRRPLYDTRIPVEDRSKLKKQQLWIKVCEEMGGDFTPTECENKFVSLRDQYMKDRHRINLLNSVHKKSGSGASDTVKPTFRHYNLMAFLNDSVEHKQTVSSLKKACDKNRIANKEKDARNLNDRQPLMDIAQSVMNLPNSLSTTPPMCKKRKQSDAIECKLIEMLDKSKDKEVDRTDGFLIMIGERLRKLPRTVQSKIEIDFLQRLLSEEEKLEENQNE